MMKTLSLFRHGKSSWKYATDDLYRPLNRRGLLQVRAMAKSCAIELPDLVLSSPADRAYATALIYTHELGISLSKLKLEPKLYEADSEQLLHYLSSLADSYDNVWVFAHNPGLQGLAEQLVRPFSTTFVTSAYLSIELDITSWENLKESRGECVVFQKPSV
jgi:phosphohistidine phosphatase